MWATGHNKVRAIMAHTLLYYIVWGKLSLYKPSVLLQTGTGQLTPNNPNSVATIVQYGLKRDLLDLTAVGAAEVQLSPCFSCLLWSFVVLWDMHRPPSCCPLQRGHYISSNPLELATCTGRHCALGSTRTLVSRSGVPSIEWQQECHNLLRAGASTW